MNTHDVKDEQDTKGKAPAKKKRITTTHKAPASEADFSAGVAECAAAQLRLETLQAQLNELLAQTGAELRKEIESIEGDVVGRLAALAGYADKHRGELFPRGKKSVATTAAEYGFAENPARLTISPDWQIEDVMDNLERLGRGVFVRKVRELDKEGIKSALRETSEVELLPEAKRPEGWQPRLTSLEAKMSGIRFSQTERFWLLPRRAVEPGNPAITA